MRLSEELRCSVLQSALQGKLTKQLKTDTPISLDKDREGLFDIPDTWIWVKVKDIAFDLDAGKSPDCEEVAAQPDKWGVIKTTAIQPNKFYGEYNKVLPENFVINETWKIKVGDLLITRAGPISRTGVACVVEKLESKLILSDKTLRINIRYDYIDRRYIAFAISSPYIRNMIVEASSGMDKQQVNISQKKILELLLPLPPFEEQQRIVTRVDALIKKIDELEKIENNLSTLKHNFPTDMRSAILQAAMQGKLTERLKTDSSVEDLIDAIEKERDVLVKSKEFKPSKKLVPLSDTEFPFDIPESWKWIKLGDCSTYGQTKQKASDEDIKSDIWSLDLEDIEKGTGRIIEKYRANQRQISGDKVRFKKGNILYSKLRPYLLKILIADDDGICTPELIPFDMLGGINPQYILWVLRSPHIDYIINSVTYGVKMPRVGIDTMVNLLIPLPPIEEQQRIVDRINCLMPLCNGLLEE